MSDARRRSLERSYLSSGARAAWNEAWRAARERWANLRKQPPRMGGYKPATQAEACLGARLCGEDEAWPRMDHVGWRAWVFCGRPGGSWEAHKRDVVSRARCMQLLAAAVRRGERRPGGRP